MPEFPRYQSKATPTTQQPSVQAVEDTSAEMIEKTAQTASAAQESVLKWSNAVDTIQKTTAEANFKAGIMDITSRAQNDPDYNNSSTYFQEIEKLRSESLRGFSNKTAETEAAIEFGYQSKVAQIQIQNLYNKKMVDVGQASTLKLIDAEVGNPTENSVQNIQKILNEQISAGVIDHKDAYELFQKSEQKVKFNTFLRDFRSDPVGAEKRFSEDSYGMDIDTAEKARSKLKELKVIQREQEGALYNDMGLRVTTGEITDDEIEAAMKANKMNPNEGITEAHGKQLLAARYRDITKRIGSSEFKKYRKAIDFVFSSSAQDRVKGYEAILEAYEGGLGKDEVKFLDQILKTKNDITFANKAAAGKKMIETLFGARPKDVEKETRALLEYAKKIAGGATPEGAAQQTAVEIVQAEHPATMANPDLVGAFTPSKGFKNIPKVKSENTTGRQESGS